MDEGEELYTGRKKKTVPTETMKLWRMMKDLSSDFYQQAIRIHKRKNTKRGPNTWRRSKS